MPALSRVCLLSLLLLCLTSCSGDPPGDSEKKAESRAAAFNDVKTPSLSEKPTVETDSDGAAAVQPSAGQVSHSTVPEPMKDSDTPDKPGTAKTKTEKAEADVKIVPQKPLPPRESLVGRWEFLLCDSGRDFGTDILGMLIDVEQEGDAYTAKVVADSQSMPGWKIASADVGKKSVSLEITDHQDRTVSFQGQLDEDGVVRGNVMFGEEGQELVRWMPTDRETLKNAPPRIPSANVDLLRGFQPDPENILVVVREKIAALGKSSLAYELCRQLSAVYQTKRPDEKQYRGFPAEYLAAAEPWGERVTQRSQLNIAYTMAICGYSPVEADEHLSVVEQDLAESSSPGIKQRVALTRGLIDLHSEDVPVRKQALASLQSILKDDPRNADVTRGLAAYYERSHEQEKALTLYADLAVFPTEAGVMEPVTRLWKELGRDPSQVDAYLDKIYKSRMHQFADAQSDAPRAEGNQQTILGELFTGGSCPPCVAADVATGGLEITYPPADLIMLRYHEHVPGPDPLAIAAGEERAVAYYRIEGTPSLFFNGQPIQVENMYGPFEYAADGYADLRKIVDPLLRQSTDLKIELKAAANDDVIDVSAAVSGADEFPETWRLRLCLVEDEIAHPARNGVRLHEMVVRAMPGGAEGVGPEDGRLAFTGSVSLEDVREEITDYLSRIPGLSPPPLELSHLHVVAFVQNDSNRRVLQATTVPVAGLAAADAQE